MSANNIMNVISKSQVIIFNGSNFPDWYEFFLATLRTRTLRSTYTKLLPTIDSNGDVEAFDSDSYKAKLTANAANNETMLGLLAMLVEPSFRKSVNNMDSIVQCVQYFQNYYTPGANSHSLGVITQKRFWNRQFNPKAEKIIQFLAQIQSDASSLGLKDDDIRSFLCEGGLPPSWSAWLDTIRDNPKYDDHDSFMIIIQREGLSRQLKDDSIRSKPHVLPTSQALLTSRPTVVSCYNCGIAGHVQRDCRKRNAIPNTARTNNRQNQTFGRKPFGNSQRGVPGGANGAERRHAGNKNSSSNRNHEAHFSANEDYYSLLTEVDQSSDYDDTDDLLDFIFDDFTISDEQKNHCTQLAKERYLNESSTESGSLYSPSSEEDNTPSEYNSDISSTNSEISTNDNGNEFNKDECSAMLTFNSDVEEIKQNTHLEWKYDTGCTHHSVNQRSYFSKFIALDQVMHTAKTGASMKILGIGSIDFIASDGTPATLTNVYYIPELSRNLLSGSALTTQNCSTSLGPKIEIYMPGGSLLLDGLLTGKLWSITMNLQTKTALLLDDIRQFSKADLTHQRIENIARAFLHSAKMPFEYYKRALQAAAHIMNRTYSKSIDGIPYEIRTGNLPDLKHIRILFCRCFVHLSIDRNLPKLAARSVECILIGFTNNGYICEELGTGKVLFSRDVTFNEHILGFDEVPALTSTNHVDDSDDDTLFLNPAANPPAVAVDPAIPAVPANEPTIPANAINSRPIRSSRGITNQKILETTAELNSANIVYTDMTFKQAMKSPDANEWLQCYKTEWHSMQSIKPSGMFLEVWLPEGANLLSVKLVMHRKTDGRRKTRPCLRGYEQIFGEDYFESYAPTAGMKTVRTTVAFAAANNITLRTFDVGNAFAQTPATERLYCELLPLYEDELRGAPFEKNITDGIKNGKIRCLELLMNLQGSKQSAANWYNDISKFVSTLGFTVSKIDPGLFYWSDGNSHILFTLYVDDFLWAATDTVETNAILERIKEKYLLKETTGKILGMTVTQNSDFISIDHHDYITAKCVEFGLEDAHNVYVPMSPGLILTHEYDRASTPDRPYRSLVMSLMHSAVMVRGEIALAVGVLATYQDTYNEVTWNAAKDVLKYLKTTKNYGLVYIKSNSGILDLTAFADADFASCDDTGRSITGYTTLINGTAISWKSVRQKGVATATAISELNAATDCVKCIILSRDILLEIGHAQTKPTLLYEDNNACISIATKPAKSRNRFTGAKYHFLREQVDNAIVDFMRVDTKDQTADMFTKPLARSQFERFREMLGIRMLTSVGVLENDVIPMKQSYADISRAAVPHAASKSPLRIAPMRRT